MYFAPAPYHGARRSTNALVAMVELLPDRAIWIAYLVAWTGDPYIGLNLSGTNRWWWGVQYVRCNWCSTFHVDTPGTTHHRGMGGVGRKTNSCLKENGITAKLSTNKLKVIQLVKYAVALQ